MLIVLVLKPLCSRNRELSEVRYHNLPGIAGGL